MIRLAKVVKVLWLAAAIALLIRTLYLYNFRSPLPDTGDEAVPMVYGMFLLSFPLGPWVVVFIAGVMLATGLEGSQSNANLIGTWFLLGAAGYFQWFIALPKALQWWRRRFSRRSP